MQRNQCIRGCLCYDRGRINFWIFKFLQKVLGDDRKENRKNSKDKTCNYFKQHGCDLGMNKDIRTSKFQFFLKN